MPRWLDPGGELGRNGVVDVPAGGHVDPLDGDLAGTQFTSPSDDLYGLAGAGTGEAAEGCAF